MSDDSAPRPISWWGAPLLGLLALGGYAVLLPLVATIRAAAHGETVEEAVAQISLDPVNLGAIQAAAFGVPLLLGLILFQRGVRVRDALALRPVGVPVVALAMVAGLALQFPLAEVGNLAQEIFPVPIEDQLRQRRLLAPEGFFGALALLLAVVVIAPSTEELLFRGLLLPGLARAYGTGFALGLTSLLFGLVHVQPVAVVYATVAGVILGSVALRTGSTLPALVMHASVNAVPVMLPERLVRIPGFNTVAEEVYHLPLPLLLGTSLVAAAALAVMARLEEPRD